MTGERVTFAMVLDELAAGEATADTLASKLCPRLSETKKSHGGPHRGAVKLSYLLGRMRQAKLVGSRFPPEGGSTIWYLAKQRRA